MHRLGTKWSEINAALGTSRSDNSIKNRFAKLRSNGAVPPLSNATAEDDSVHTAFAEFLCESDDDDEDFSSSQRVAASFNPMPCELEACLHQVATACRVSARHPARAACHPTAATLPVVRASAPATGNSTGTASG